MNFPLLITGERVQSSAVRSETAQYIEHYFEGFNRQTHLTTEADLKTWRLVYTNLFPEEAMTLRSFFEALPVGGEFTFTDPWTGVVYNNCRLADPRLTLHCDKDNRYSAHIEVEHAS